PPRELQSLADAVVPAGRPGDWTHALMDVGATVCRPRSPRCGDCPARAWCRYAASGPPAAATGSARGRRPRSRPAEPAFPTTTRWLRGRIVDRAREADDGAWIPFDDAIGAHDRHAVREAVTALASEGLLEVRETAHGPEARLPA